MQERQKILKSLALAGVEWELAGAPGGIASAAVRDSLSIVHCPLPPRAPVFRAPKPAAPQSDGDILETANRLANEPDIVAAIKRFTLHPLYKGAKNTVPPHIPAAARLLVITDIPSASDDAAGRILTGAEGELFDKMIGAIGLTRESVIITPLTFWRPAGGRRPTADELKFCRPFVDKIIAAYASAAAAPPRILTLGALAAKEIAGATLPRDHGKKIDNRQPLPTDTAHSVIPIYKPDFIIANPATKKDVWAALQQLNG